MITLRVIILLFIGLFIASCGTMEKPAVTGEKKQEVLYIHSDGRMEFNGRFLNEEDVVIYEDGYGGERAAVRLRVPLHPDIFRDTITVERKYVPVERID